MQDHKALLKELQSHIGQWTGWDWAHDFAQNGESVYVNGPGEILDWDEWETETAAEYGEAVAQQARVYGEGVQDSAETYNALLETALMKLSAWDLEEALADIKEAQRLEGQYGGAFLLDPLVKGVAALLVRLQNQLT